MPDDTQRLPDFTVARLGKRVIYWEHLGMLGKAGYRANWEAKQAWYAGRGILPWTQGDGRNGVLVWSDEGTQSGGIDAEKIEHLTRDVLALATCQPSRPARKRAGPAGFSASKVTASRRKRITRT